MSNYKMSKIEWYDMAQAVVNYELNPPREYTVEQLRELISKATSGNDVPGFRD